MSASGYTLPSDAPLASLFTALPNSTAEAIEGMSRLAASTFYSPQTGAVRRGALTHVLRYLPAPTPSATAAATTLSASASADAVDGSSLVNASAALNTFNHDVNMLKAPTRARPALPSRFYSPDIPLSQFNQSFPLLAIRAPVQHTSAALSLLSAAGLRATLPVPVVGPDVPLTTAGVIAPLESETLEAADQIGSPALGGAGDEGDSGYRRILLTQKVSTYEELLALTSATEAAASASGGGQKSHRPPRGSASVPTHEVLPRLLTMGCTIAPHELRVGYGFFSHDHALSALLPPTVPVPGAFTQVGHIAHINLRDEQLPFKLVIGRVLLDKNAAKIRTVVNKVGGIDNVYRNFQAEVLAARSRARVASGATVNDKGDCPSTGSSNVWHYYFKGASDSVGSTFAVPAVAASSAGTRAFERDDDDCADSAGAGGWDGSLLTLVKEQSATFELDFGEVYWNSRLQAEHRRVVRLMLAAAGRPAPAAASAAGGAAKGKAAKGGNVKEGNAKGGSDAKQAAAPRQTQQQHVVTARPINVLDPFAGIGPFAVPAAQLGCNVWASDLNPKSALYLYKNSLRNKVTPRLKVLNADGRALIRALARQQLLQSLQHLLSVPPGAQVPALPASGPVALPTSLAQTVAGAGAGAGAGAKAGPCGVAVPWFDHVIMNLPASATTFLDVFRGLYDPTLSQAAGPASESKSEPASADLSPNGLSLLANYPSLPAEFFGPAHAAHYSSTPPAALAPWIMSPAGAPVEISGGGEGSSEGSSEAISASGTALTPEAVAALALARAHGAAPAAPPLLRVHRAWARALGLLPSAQASGGAEDNEGWVVVEAAHVLKHVRFDMASGFTPGLSTEVSSATATEETDGETVVSWGSSAGSSSPCITVTRAHLQRAGLRGPTVHCYCFARTEGDYEGDAMGLAEDTLGYSVARMPPRSGSSGGAEQKTGWTGDNEWYLVPKPATADSDQSNNKSSDNCASASEDVGSSGCAPATAESLPAGSELFYQRTRRLAAPPSSAAPRLRATDGQLEARSSPDGWNLDVMLSDIAKYGVYVHDVRNVAPLKEMMCVEFALRRDILFALPSAERGARTPTLVGAGLAKARDQKDYGRDSDDDDDDGHHKHGAMSSDEEAEPLAKKHRSA